MSETTPTGADKPPRRLGSQPSETTGQPSAGSRPVVVPPPPAGPTPPAQTPPVDLAAARQAQEARARAPAPQSQGPTPEEIAVAEYNQTIRAIAADLALGFTTEAEVRSTITGRGAPVEVVESTMDDVEQLLDIMARNLSATMEAPAKELLNRAGAGMSRALLEHDAMQAVELTFTMRRTPGGHEVSAYAHLSREIAPGVPEWAYNQLTEVTAADPDQLGELLATTMEKAWTQLQGG